MSDTNKEREAFWHAVVSESCPIINKAIRREDVAEEYASKCRDEGYGDIEVVPLYRAEPSAQVQGEKAQMRQALEHCLNWLPEDCAAACEARAVLALAPGLSGWQPIASAPKNRKVIVGYFNQLGKHRTVMASYYPAETLESEHTDSGWADEGWYEECESQSETIMPTDCEPTHWMPLPPAPGIAPHQPQPEGEDFEAWIDSQLDECDCGYGCPSGCGCRHSGEDQPQPEPTSKGEKCAKCGISYGYHDATCNALKEQEHGELDPLRALDHARTMRQYVFAFNGEKFGPFDNVDRINLATALDNLEETTAMLMNMANRVASQQREPQEAAGYLDGVNVDRLRKALTKMGCSSGAGEEDAASRLAELVNRLTLSVERFALSAPQEAEKRRDERETFEAHMHGYSLARDGDGYIDWNTRSAWWVWQASASIDRAPLATPPSAMRAALVETEAVLSADDVYPELHKMVRAALSAPQEAGKPAWKCADRLNDCRELCGSSQCFSKEAGKVEAVADERTPFGQGVHRFTVYANPRTDIRADLEQWLFNWKHNYGDEATAPLLEQAFQDFEPKISGDLRRAVRMMAGALCNKEWAEHCSNDPDASNLEIEITKLLYLRPSQQALSDEAKDALRYRWLREVWPMTLLEDLLQKSVGRHPSAELDKAIDSAILAAAGGSQ